MSANGGLPATGVGGGIAAIVLCTVAIGSGVAVVAYRSYAESVEHYEYVLDAGEQDASGNMRWAIGRDSSDARIWLNIGIVREYWEYEFEHDSEGRIVAWSFEQGARTAEWRYEGGTCTFSTPDGVDSSENCAPLPHPLLGLSTCGETECTYSSPNLRFTALERREWRQGPVGTTAGGREMRSLRDLSGETLWYASGDHSPDYLSLPNGLVWMRTGAPLLPEDLRQIPSDEEAAP